MGINYLSLKIIVGNKLDYKNCKNAVPGKNMPQSLLINVIDNNNDENERYKPRY